MAKESGFSQGMLSLAQSCSESAIYLMGLSFIVGSLFTIFVLLVLDFVRRTYHTDSAEG